MTTAAAGVVGTMMTTGGVEVTCDRPTRSHSRIANWQEQSAGASHFTTRRLVLSPNRFNNLSC
jgi:hypothetical protein